MINDRRKTRFVRDPTVKRKLSYIKYKIIKRYKWTELLVQKYWKLYIYIYYVCILYQCI